MVTHDESLLDVADRDEVSGKDRDPVLEGVDEAGWWKSRYQAEHARAEAAEARCEELRWAEVKARSEANSYKRRVQESRRKLEAERKTLSEVRRDAKEGLAQHAEIARLRQLLDDAGVDANKQSTVMSFRKKVHELQSQNKVLKDEVAVLKGENQALNDEVAAVQTKLDESHSIREKEVAALEKKLDESRSIRVGLSKTLYGKRSEQQLKPPSKRKPGQQPGAPGHGRTPRPDLKEKVERIDPPKADRTCGKCGKPYVANGGCPSTVIEVEVKAYTRKIIRSRWQAGCGCDPGSPEVIAPAVPRLFRGTDFGIRFWTWFLMERFVFSQPYRRIADRLRDSGLSVSAGTLADRTASFIPLFSPLAEAIMEHQNQAVVRQADETSWPVQEWAKDRKSRRGWLWTSLSEDTVFYHVALSRSAEVAHKLFAGLGDEPATVYLVCDRYSAYKKLARELLGRIILCFCWAHTRRDFVKAANGYPDLTDWCETWIEKIGELYHLNGIRLELIDWNTDAQSTAYQDAHQALKEKLDAFFAEVDQTLLALPQDAREGKPLRSLKNHRDGLCVFLDQPRVPMDNNTSERKIKEWVIGRKISFGSSSVQGAELKAFIHTVLGTVGLNGLNVQAWLMGWLTECARQGGKPPEDLTNWLPWTMSPSQQRRLEAPP